MKSLIFLITFSLFGVNISNAQIVDRTENRAKQKANQRVDQKIDKGLDKGLDAIEGLFGKKKKDKSKGDEDSEEVASETENTDSGAAAQSDMMSKMFGGGDLDVQDSYTFDHNILMNIQTFDKKGKTGDEMKMTMYFSDETPHFGMSMDIEGGNNFIIYDMETYEMVSLMDNNGQKIGMTMKLNPDKFVNNDEGKKENGNISFEKTGRTKTISGYNCEEYKLNDPEGDPNSTTTFWMTTDIDANWIEMMSTFASTNKKMQKNFVLPEDYPKGSMIQIINASNKNEEKSVTTVEKINKNTHKVIETKGYQMMALPGSGK